MDPGRAAMISGWKSPNRRSPRRDITAPRRDGQNRVTKSSYRNDRDRYDRRDRNDRGDRSDRNGRPPRGGDDSKRGSKEKEPTQTYMTEEQLSERFVAEEDKFVLRQSKKKADIRVRERRAKPIDFLAFYVRFIDPERDVFDDDPADIDIKVPPPEEVLEASRDWQLRELQEDLQSFLTLEKNKQTRDYWKALLALCKEYLLRRAPQDGEDRLIGSVATDIDKILQPKTLTQLEALEKQIHAKLRSDEPIDTDYWEQLLKRLQVWKSKATLLKIDGEVQAKRKELLAQRDPAAVAAARKRETDGDEGGVQSDEDEPVEPAAAASSSAAAAATTTTIATKTTGGSTSSAPPPGTSRFATVSNEDFSQATKALYEREVARGVNEDEEIFAAEEAVPVSTRPKWAAKYRPRKPRYFNRVQMGYEWNKYNQTHYDHDNPPPKVVQGYKFNIFYPELIDKMKAPTYRIIREDGRRRGESFAPAGEEDTCLIRFSAGPPYEDIAFRIVDREWDYSSKRERGFKSSYEKGILQLHFQFKKVYYRK